MIFRDFDRLYVSFIHTLTVEWCLFFWSTISRSIAIVQKNCESREWKILENLIHVLNNYRTDQQLETRVELAKVGQNAREWAREDEQQTRKDGSARLHAQCQPASGNLSEMGHYERKTFAFPL